MAVQSRTIPDELIAGLRTGDQPALEQGFQQIFPGLLAEAEAELHDKATSVRVVEHAFLQVLADPPAGDAAVLDQVIARAMHHSIVREQSRLAALQRFERNEGVSHVGHRAVEAADAAHSWKHIQEVRARAAAPRVSVDPREGQHVAAAHLAAAMRPERRRWSIGLIILAVLALCAAGFALTRIDPRPTETFVTGQLNAPAARSINSAPGQIGNVLLSDGTGLRIGAGSRLKVVNEYGDRLRAISVTGAASFTIAPSDKPLEIRAKGIAVSANDGRIDVRADENRPPLVRVVSGSPRITIGDSSWIAAAGQSVVADGGIRFASVGEIEEAFSWMEGRFFVSGTVRDVVDGFRRWYDVDVGIGDNSIADWPAQATGSLESLTSSLASLERSAKVKMTWVNRHMLLFRK